MAGRDSQDAPLSITKSTVGNVRESQDVTLAAKKATTANVRDSQDVSLIAEKATTAKVRNSQDIELYLMRFFGARNSQEALLTVQQSTPSSVAAARLSQDIVLYLQSSVTPAPTSSACYQYYLSLITSEYQNSPKFLAWLKSTLQFLCDIRSCVDNLYLDFDLDQAVGPQLDILGQIIGASRMVTFQPSGSISPVLDDITYRILLKAKVAQNEWDGQSGSLYGIWQSLFPGGRIVIIDNQNMTANIILAGAFTSIIQDLIINGLIVPRPEAVQYNYLFPTLPIFGFDQDNAFVAGFDKGHLA
jgi:hypothetical protein